MMGSSGFEVGKRDSRIAKHEVRGISVQHITVSAYYVLDTVLGARDSVENMASSH